MTFRRRLRRVLVLIAAVATLVVVLAALSLAELLLVVGGASMAPTIRACNGRGLAEGFTYRFRDPHRGELVVFHARGELGQKFTPRRLS